MPQHFEQKSLVLITDATRLDDDVGFGGSQRDLKQCLRGRIVHHHRTPVGCFDIAMFLAVVNIGFVEGDVIAKARKSLEKSTIVGRRSIPVGGEQARSHRMPSSLRRLLLFQLIDDLRAPVLRENVEKFVHAVTARMPGGDRLDAVRGKSAGKVPVLQHKAQQLTHLASASGKQEVLAGTKKTFRVVPRRRNKRDSTCQSFEHADRRDAGQALDIGPAGYMDGYPMAGEGIRHFGIGQPAAIVDAGGCKCGERSRRIAHTVNGRR